MYKCIIFDVDGTMVDTEEAVRYAYQSVIFEKYGRYFSNEELLQGYGVPTPQTLEIYGFTDIEKAEMDYYRYLIEGFKKCCAFSGIQGVLEKIKEKNIPMGIVTSRCKYEIDSDPCLQGLIKYFNTVVGSEDTALHKPNAQPLLKAVENLDADPSQTIYIGDTIFDSTCACNAGIKFALALWGSNNSGNIDADYFLEKPSELLKLI